MRSLVLVAFLLGSRLAAQTDYYNSDGGRPLRVEDAAPTARFAFDLHFPTARVERLAGGVTRLRVEPALAYGILPRTAVEARAAFVYRERGAAPRGGMTGVALGVMHALNTETRTIPAFAVAGEFHQPTGSAKTGGPAYSLRALATRTFSGGRLHANATFGTYNVSMQQQSDTACTVDPSSPVQVPQCGAGGTRPPFIPDGPCSIAPGDAGAVVAARCDGPGRAAAARQMAAVVASTKTLRGAHRVIGIGGDRVFALSSVLLMADVFGEQYAGLFEQWDWTAELGARHQLSPSVTMDASVGRRFAGVTRAWIFSGGLTRTSPLGLLGKHDAR
jgi:hypothetical protein